MIKKMIGHKILLLSFIALFVSIIGCGGGGGGGGSSDTPSAMEADVLITTLQFGEATIFSVTLKSVTGLNDAASFNLIGEDARPNSNINETADNFVLNKTTITMEIYDSSSLVIASTILDSSDYETPYQGTISISEDSQNQLVESDFPVFKSSSSEIPSYETFDEIESFVQIGNLDILASGIFDVKPTGTRSIQVPLNCGPTVPGQVTPGPNEGYFIINDVIIEYYYALANAVAFNTVLTVKFRESGRNFENMTLAFRLPNSTNVYRVRPKPFKLLTSAEEQTILGNVTTAVNTNNPFETAIAYVDLEVTQFGSSYLVETTVTRVVGDCVAGAQSFTVWDGNANEEPEPPKAILDQVDKNTLEDDLILYILGNEVEVRNPVLDSCGSFSPSNSGGSEGTLDLWDISAIDSGATFDFEFDAYSEPDKFRVEYPTGTILLDTGWRGSIAPIDGTLEGPGAFNEYNLFTKGGANTLKVLVTGGRPGTAWNYRVRCNDPN